MKPKTEEKIITLKGSQVTGVTPEVYGGEVKSYNVLVPFKGHPHQLFRIDADQAHALILQGLKRRKTMKTIKKTVYAYIQDAIKVTK